MFPLSPAHMSYGVAGDRGRHLWLNESHVPNL